MHNIQNNTKKIRKNKQKIIIDVALDLFANKGYSATSISQIAEKANISKSLIYNYFKSKEDLLKTIIHNFNDEITNMIGPAHDNKLSEKEALHFFDRFFKLLMTRTEEMKLFIQFTIQPEVLNFMIDDLIFSHRTKKNEQILSFLEEKHKENTRMVIMNFSVIFKGIMVLYVFSPEKFSHELMIQYREYLKNMFIRKIYKL